MKYRALVAVITGGLLLSACTPVVSVHGIEPDPDALAAVSPGQSDKTDVESKLGTPSTVGTFNDEVWYYMSETRSQKAFLDPKIVERKIVAVTFDERERVEDIFTYTEKDGQEIEIVSRVTPTAGNELTILQQLFGNLGRFSSSGS